MPTAPVHATNRSACGSSAASASSVPARAGVPCSTVISASRRALASVRLSTTTSATSARRRCAAASPPIAPAPTITARRPASPPSAQRGVGEGLGDDGGARGVDAGVGVHPLADAQRLLGELVQHAPDRARARRRGVGVAELAEDLRLADDHRVEPRRHREQVLHGRARVVDVDVLGELGQRHAGVPLQHGGDVGEAAVERVDDGVDLDAVARRDEHRLRDVLAAQHLGDELGHVGGAPRRPARGRRRARCGGTAPRRARS